MDKRRIAFSLVVLAYLGFLGLINVLMLLPGNPIAAMGHFSFINTGDTHNLIHEMVFALIVGTAAVGLASQLFKPKENYAGQLVALTAWVVMILAATVTNNWVPQPLFIIFGGLTLLATILHPIRSRAREGVAIPGDRGAATSNGSTRQDLVCSVGCAARKRIGRCLRWLSQQPCHCLYSLSQT